MKTFGIEALVTPSPSNTMQNVTLTAVRRTVIFFSEPVENYSVFYFESVHNPSLIGARHTSQ